jgi:hypothetical protein
VRKAGRRFVVAVNRAEVDELLGFDAPLPDY